MMLSAMEFLGAEPLLFPNIHSDAPTSQYLVQAGRVRAVSNCYSLTFSGVDF